MKLTDDELRELHAKATAIALSMSDFLRKKSGFPPTYRGVGRPGRRVRCTQPGCPARVAVSGLSKHLKEVHNV
jgi:hypothetical protein